MERHPEKEEDNWRQGEGHPGEGNEKDGVAGMSCNTLWGQARMETRTRCWNGGTWMG